MNKVMLIGNVGKDPDVRYYDADQAVAQFPLATTERGYTLQNGTRVPDHTDWHNIIVYRNLAKVVEKYVRKGDRICVEGRIRYRNYDDKKGVRHYVTEILVENMEMLSNRPQPTETNVAQQPTAQPVQQENANEPENEALPF